MDQARFALSCGRISLSLVLRRLASRSFELTLSQCSGVARSLLLHQICADHLDSRPQRCSVRIGSGHK